MDFLITFTKSLYMPHIFCLCHRQSVSGTDILCPLQILFLNDLIYEFCHTFFCDLEFVRSVDFVDPCLPASSCPLILILLPRQGLTSKEMAKLGGRELATLAGREKKRAKSLLRNPFSALQLR